MPEQVKALYLEITEFWHGFKGPYAQIDVATYRDLIDAIIDGRCRVTRDASGLITSASTWWMIWPDDVELVKKGGRPDDINGGSVVYVADHCGSGGLAELIRFIRVEIGKKGVCWHHKYKTPERFRYYPDKVGHNV